TAISMSLNRVARRQFQIAVALVVPLFLSLYFIKDATSITLQGVVGDMSGPYLPGRLIQLGLIALFSWAFGDQLNREHPFRGFLIACAVIFVICLKGYYGIHWE